MHVVLYYQEAPLFRPLACDHFACQPETSRVRLRSATSICACRAPGHPADGCLRQMSPSLSGLDHAGPTGDAVSD